MRIAREATPSPQTGKAFTQGQLARAIGVSGNTISEIERGREPSLNVLAAIAKELGRPLAWFVGDEDTAASPAPSVATVADGVGDPITQLVRQGQAEQAAWVLEFAAKLLEAGARRLREADSQLRAPQKLIKSSLSDAAAHVAQRQSTASSSAAGRRKKSGGR